MTGATMNFLRLEDGAVTVDWVVLTASVVGLGLATMAVVSAGTEDLSRDIDGQLQTDHIMTSFGSAVSGVWGEFDMMNEFGRDQAWWDSWASEGNSTWPGSDNAGLTARYEAAYAGFHDPNDAWSQTEAIDAIGATEAELLERGIEIPDGNESYADLYATLNG